MLQKVVEGNCICCGIELITIWDKGDCYCPPYVDYTNLDDDYNGYCQVCIQKIERHKVYQELSDITFFDACNNKVTLYCRYDGSKMSEFLLD